MKQASSAPSRIQMICDRYDCQPDSLIEILLDVQYLFGYVPDEKLIEIATALNLSRAEVYGVKSFYDDFTDQPPAGVDLKICQGEACQSMGSKALAAGVKEQFGLRGHTGALEENFSKISPERLSLGTVFCLGNCALSPAATIDGKLLGRLDIRRLGALIEKALP